MIGRTIGCYLFGMGGGLLLARFLEEPALLGFILIGVGIAITGVFVLRDSQE